MPTDEFIRRAVEIADPNVLRIVLLQLTGDERLAEMELTSASGRGGALTMPTLSPDDVRIVQDLAFDHLRTTADNTGAMPPPPDGERLGRLQLFSGECLSGSDLEYRKAELGMEEAPFAATWPDGRPKEADDVEVLIIGAGLSGIAMGVQLSRLGIRYRVLERRQEVGGTWSINRYPDARVDTTSFLYQYTFEKQHRWSEHYGRQSEVRAYLEHIATSYGVMQHIEFDTDVRTGRFDEATGTWTVQVVTGGNERTLTADFVVAATGLFGNPRGVDLPGIDQFKGDVVHSTAWSDDLDVTGRRVALVGNGSTGVQMLAPIASQASHVLVHQRTPQWISPSQDYRARIEPELQWVLDTVPYYWNWHCYSKLLPYLSLAEAQVIDRDWQQQGGDVSQRNDGVRAGLTAYIESQLAGHPDLIHAVTPDYPPLARRLVIDNDWYTSLLRDDVELVTTPIEKVGPRELRYIDGTVRNVDVIVAAVGFSTTKYVWPAEFTGRDGIRLQDAWAAKGPRAHLGLTVPGFPNLFLMYGPNAQTQAARLISFIELWAAHISRLVMAVVGSDGTSIEVREEAFEEYNARIDEVSEDIVWNLAPPGKNYYLNEHGRQHVTAPWSGGHYFELMTDTDLSAYVLH